MEFLPEVREIVEHAKAEGGDKLKVALEVEALVAATLEMDEHKWFTGNEPTGVKKARLKELKKFKERYNK